ncbi:MAG: radical SAM protein [Candidatus Aenigmarchaeota archaeon]|nr:radical SAM protein [Candidatus Aenigmarchaeota archaeon]
MHEEKIARRIMDWKKGKKVGPFEVQFNPTNRCNLKCKFCWLRDFDNGGLNTEELPTKKYKEMVKDASDMGVHTIEITGGGEPLFRKDTFEIMKLVKKYNMFGRLITNGTLFTEEMIKGVVKIGWDEIVFSLDAPEKEINDFLRGGGFEKVVGTIKKIQTMKSKLNLEKPYIHIHMVLCNKNYKLLPKMFEFVYSLGITNLLIEPIVLLAKKTGSGKELMFRKRDEKKLIEALNKAKEIAYEYGFQTNVDKLELSLVKNTSKMKKIVKKEGIKHRNKLLEIPCYQPFHQMVVRPWGIVGPCCMFEYSPENVRDKSLKEIWFGEYFEKMRERMLKRDLPDFCSKCNPSQIQENRKIRVAIKGLL